MFQDNFIQSAFDQVCKRAKTAESWYVCLIEAEPYYGGPEEGGVNKLGRVPYLRWEATSDLPTLDFHRRIHYVR